MSTALGLNERIDTSGDPADHAAFACRVPALEHHDDACARGLDPSLQTSKLDLELGEVLLKFLALHLAGCSLRPSYVAFLLVVFCHVAAPLPLLETRAWQGHHDLTSRSGIRPDLIRIVVQQKRIQMARLFSLLQNVFSGRLPRMVVHDTAARSPDSQRSPAP